MQLERTNIKPIHTGDGLCIVYCENAKQHPAEDSISITSEGQPIKIEIGNTASFQIYGWVSNTIA